MKKILISVLSFLPMMVFAQMPGMQMPNLQELPEETVTSYTQTMVSDLGLSEDQAAQVLDLNKRYLGKVEYPVVLPPEAEEAMKNAGNRQGGAGFDPGSMSAEDRQKMMSMMEEMQDMMAQMQDNQEEYEKGLSAILDKKQMKAWKKAKKHYQAEQRIRMEQQFGGGFGGDFGGFGGGFGGDFGGGFGGGFGF